MTPRILVRLPNWVGDAVMATPAIAALRGAFPKAQIDGLGKPSICSLLATNPHLNSLIELDESKMHRAQLNAAKYDASLLLPNSLGSAWDILRTGIPKRFGYARPPLRRLLLTDSLPYIDREWKTPTPKPLSPKSRQGSREDEAANPPGHMVDYYLRAAKRLIEQLGGTPTASPLKLELPIDEAAARRLASLIDAANLKDAELIGLNPGAAYGRAKRWPLERLAETGKTLTEQGRERGAKGVLVSTASAKESNLNDELQLALGSGTTLIRLGEHLDLPGLVALVDRLAVLVTNDSGTMHIAAARGIPTVSIFGPTDWNVTKPWSNRATVVRNSPDCAPCFLRECPIDHRCMTSILPETVVNAARQLLRG